MKKILVVAVMLIAFAASVGAQDKPAGLVAKGLKAGLNIAGHRGNDTDEFHKNLTAFAFGGFITYQFHERVAVQPELLYMMRGAKWESGSDTWKGKYNYLEVPILFKFMIPTRGTVQPNVYVGPSFGFLLSATEEWSYDFGGQIDSGSEDVKDYLKSPDIALAFGVGSSVALGQGNLMFEARYNLGLTKIYETDPEFPDAGQPDIKSKVISFMVGYGF